MPTMPPSPCRQPGCGALTHGRFCDGHRRTVRRQADARRGSASARGYDRRWRKARAVYLQSHPLCLLCAARGAIVASTTVDHIIPHRGDAELFWDEDNWQALCKPCHDAKTAREDGGFGLPDRRHRGASKL